MNEKQIEREIAYLSDRLKFYESLILPLITGEVLAAISQHFLQNVLYLCLFTGGIVAMAIIRRITKKLSKKIYLLIEKLNNG
jgi:hypothetical protein